MIVEHVGDLSTGLKQVSGLDESFPLIAGHGDEARHGGSGLDSREPKHLGVAPRDMYEPDLNIDTLKIQARNFR